MPPLHRPRSPKGIRRWYDDHESSCTRVLSPGDAADILHRPVAGTSIKKSRLGGLKDDTHTRDGSWKNIAQDISKLTATRNGHSWQPWENDFLLRAADEQDLLSKAVRLRRTYRACESQRRDVLRQLDAERSAA